MSAKTSKETSDREKACRFVLSALFQQGQEIAQLLIELFLPHRQESDPEPNFFATVVAIGRKLKHAIDEVVAADSRLFAANAALDAERLVRKRKALTLNRQIIGLRGACKSLFVDLPVQQLGFDERTFQDPVPLLIQADRVVESLKNGENEAETLFPDDDFSPKKYAVQVRGTADGLRDCLDHIADLRRKADEALLHKRAVTEVYDELFLYGARTFESYCRMAGKTELANRVRPSESRRGRTQVPPEETASSKGSDEPKTEAAQAEAGQAEAVQAATVRSEANPAQSAQASSASNETPAAES